MLILFLYNREVFECSEKLIELLLQSDIFVIWRCAYG